jgi:hypothetical protein
MSFDVIFESDERLETSAVSTGYKTVLGHQMRQFKLKLSLIMEAKILSETLYFCSELGRVCN